MTDRDALFQVQRLTGQIQAILVQTLGSAPVNPAPVPTPAPTPAPTPTPTTGTPPGWDTAYLPPGSGGIGPVRALDWNTPGERVPISYQKGVDYSFLLDVRAGTRQIEFRFGPAAGVSGGSILLWITDPSGNAVPQSGRVVTKFGIEHGDLRVGPDYNIAVVAGRYTAWARALDFTGEGILNWGRA